jgi:hypothetical protein
MQFNRRERREREEDPHKPFCFFICDRPEAAGEYQSSSEALPHQTGLCAGG